MIFYFKQNSILINIKITPNEVRDSLKPGIIILEKFKRDKKGFLSAKGFGILNFDEPVESHDKLGAADHITVDKDALFEPILSILRAIYF